MASLDYQHTLIASVCSNLKWRFGNFSDGNPQFRVVLWYVVSLLEMNARENLICFKMTKLLRFIGKSWLLLCFEDLIITSDKVSIPAGKYEDGCYDSKEWDCWLCRSICRSTFELTCWSSVNNRNLWVVSFKTPSHGREPTVGNIKIFRCPY